RAFSSSSLSPRQSLQDKKADLDTGPSVSASKNSVPDSDVRDRFDDWVVGLQFVPDYLHHPVLANRAFPARRQIGRFCGDFRALIFRIFVSVDAQPFWWRFLAA